MTGELVLPETWAQIAVIVVAVVPGFVYQVSRRRVRGPDPDETGLGMRVLRAIMASAIFVGVYTVLLGPWAADHYRDPDTVAADIQLIGVGFLVLVALVPWAAARIGFYITSSPPWLRARRWFKERGVRNQFDPRPSAWDFLFEGRSPGWVRVLTSDGRWVGGWWGKGSFATSFPDPKELFIEVGYALTEDGTFTEEVSAPGGVFVANVVLLDFIPVEPENGVYEREGGSA